MLSHFLGKGLRTAPCSDCALNALAIDESLEYARLYLNGNMQMWIDAEGRQHFRLSLLDYPSVKPDGAVNGGANQNQSKHNVIPRVIRLCIPMTSWYSPCEMAQRLRQKFKIQQNRKGIFRFMRYSIYVAKNNKKG